MNKWTTTKPAKDKEFYLFQKGIEWGVKFGMIKKGDWRLSQNPEEFYFKNAPVLALAGSWYGPIPPPPNKTQ